MLSALPPEGADRRLQTAPQNSTSLRMRIWRPYTTNHFILVSVTAMADRAPALLEHIVSRIEQDVQFLVDQHYISAQDAAAIVARLPSTTSQTSAPITSPPPTYAGAQPVMARALWAYNEKSTVRCFLRSDRAHCSIFLRIPMTCLLTRAISLRLLRRPTMVSHHTSSYELPLPHGTRELQTGGPGSSTIVKGMEYLPSLISTLAKLSTIGQFISVQLCREATGNGGPAGTHRCSYPRNGLEEAVQGIPGLLPRIGRP